MSARNPAPFSIRPAHAGEVPSGDADLAHALLTDPDGAFVAVDVGGRVAGFAVAAVREDTTLLLALEVNARDREKGAGRGLLAAVRAHGAARQARILEAVIPNDPPVLAFFLRDGLFLRTLVLDLARAGISSPPPRGERALNPVGLGAPLIGWIADLDRETRGFARPRDWARWIAEGQVASFKRAGRPQALGGTQDRDRGAAVGPIVARSPEAASDFLSLVVSACGARPLSLSLPAENRSLLVSAAALDFRPVATRVLVTSRRRGDFRRYAGGGGRFF